MWGQGRWNSDVQRRERIIPTRVGTRNKRQGFGSAFRDHPHACGDKYVAFVTAKEALRIIPTRVGTSIVVAVSCVIVEDHPHACGDKGLMRLCARYAPGSSPRVWGQEVCVAGLCKGTGIIPTRVGTRLMKYIPDGSVEDHPHACGDKAS